MVIDIQKKMEQIRNLRQKIPANGATEAEAISAMEMANRLMEKYSVTEADLRKLETKQDMRFGTFKQRQKQQHPVSKYCAHWIFKFCEVRGWFKPRTGSTEFFGLNSDVDMAEFLMSMLQDAMDRGWKEFLRDNPKGSISRHTEYWSYMAGFGSRVNMKLKELVELRAIKTGSTGTSLVVMKDEVVGAALEVILPDLKLSKAKKSATKLTHGAYSQGVQAGDKVNLNRPLNDGVKQRRIA